MLLKKVPGTFGVPTAKLKETTLRAGTGSGPFQVSRRPPSTGSPGPPSAGNGSVEP
jgi:hypothetical protein